MVRYPYDVFGASWDFPDPQAALDAAVSACKKRGRNCGSGGRLDAFSTNANPDKDSYTDSDGNFIEHMKTRCITVWILPNPSLSGLLQANWTTGKKPYDHLLDRDFHTLKTVCNSR